MIGKLVYQGSVKNLLEAGPGRLEFEYTDAYSVFDWGRMPDALPGKGESLAALGAWFFKEVALPQSWQRAKLGSSRWLKPFTGRLREVLEREIHELETAGLAHHFIERSAPSRLLVQRVAVQAPRAHALAGQTLYHYDRVAEQNAGRARLIPLEVVFRFGLPAGSSFLERLTPEYARALGLSALPEAGQWLELPVVEFFSKLESTDRFLTWEQALNYSGVPYAVFEKLVARSLCLAVWLAGVFEARTGLELWDGKFEWALSEKGELWLVDSIGPDELRLLDPRTGTQISKEFLRLFYRKTAWFEAIKTTKKEAMANPDADWKKLATQRAGEPPRLSREFLEAATALYPSLALAVAGENPGGRGVALDAMLERIRKCLEAR